jgi:hypothetical protein
MLRTRHRRIAIALLSLACASPALAANRTEIPLEDARVIVSPEGAARILLKPTDLSAIEGRLVTDARLELTLSGDQATDELQVQVRGVSREWNAETVSWSSPWENGGGDTVDFFHQTRSVAAGRNAVSLSFDVSQFVRPWATDDLAPNGFLITTLPSRADGFRSDDLEVLGALGGSKLVVHWRAMPEVALREE